MISYSGKEINFTGCPGCAYAKHEFMLDCGIAYQDEYFTVSQDWELPIQGFFVICPASRHVESLKELTDDELAKMFVLAAKTEKILVDMGVAKQFNFVIQEKQGVHLHLWLMPQQKWMEKLTLNPMANVKAVFDYAKANLRTQENLDAIKEISIRLGEALNK